MVPLVRLRALSGGSRLVSASRASCPRFSMRCLRQDPGRGGVKRLALFIIEVSRFVAQLELASGSG